MVVLVTFLVLAPWIAASIWFWLSRPRDGAIPPSMAEAARQRR
jgi:hypothetical protein